ncbi:MAG: hypothetical protein A3F68_12620 [Acidobacteria bacterium RIFCSPLOWO2_12_FULL_54_10]|nr:MAG: hypothetical protein A3F68_12620 [Acidobacteria bacterium RIFCSPLOWO2_12_FULL_54_10]
MLSLKRGWLLLLLTGLLVATGCGRRPYETPIVTSSLQPDKELFDRAVDDLEESRFTRARLILQTLINTYPDSEYLSKAKLAVADSWYQEGGTSNLTQAEAEYRDFITFFPTLPESAEAQMRVAMIHYQGMEKPDRDVTHARRAEQEFQKLILSQPDSPFAPLAEQRLREVQEVLAQGLFDIARFYFIQGYDPGAQPRLKELIERYPNFSQADSALYLMGRTAERSGEKNIPQAVEHYSSIVRDYPLGARVDEAKQRLTALSAPIPEPSADAVARMTYESTLAQSQSMMGKIFGGFTRGPDVTAAKGKIGMPTLTAQGAAQPGALSAVFQPQRSTPAASSTNPNNGVFLEQVTESGTAGNSP